MDSYAYQLTLGLLPEPSTRWERFVFSYGVQSAVLALFVIAAVAYPEVLVAPVHDYHFVSLVSTPRPAAEAPVPIPHFPVAKISELATPRPEAMRVPSELAHRKKLIPDDPAPQVALSAPKELLPEAKPLIPKRPVQTNVFSAGNSAAPTMAAAPTKVQTGGFGDPNGVPASATHGRPITIAQAGSFDMPYGPGIGGSQGARGVVASTGFGNGYATGNAAGSASRGGVRQAGFGDADVVTVPPKSRSVEAAVHTLPAEITFKPRPVYTDEGRHLKIEGEVLLDVIFSATGQIRIVKVVRGLGHGLDESAVHAAEKIQFKPAQKDGQPADFEAVLHIVFQLAS